MNRIYLWKQSLAIVFSNIVQRHSSEMYFSKILRKTVKKYS